jgi:hypothetical protein
VSAEPNQQVDPPGNIPQPSARDQKEFRQKLETAQELQASEITPSPTAVAVDTGIPGLSTVRGLVHATFFFDLFCHHANRRFKHVAPQSRVASLIVEAPRFYKFCIVADVSFRVAALLVLLIGLGLVVFFTIAKVFAG